MCCHWSFAAALETRLDCVTMLNKIKSLQFNLSFVNWPSIMRFVLSPKVSYQFHQITLDFFIYRLAETKWYNSIHNYLYRSTLILGINSIPLRYYDNESTQFRYFIRHNESTQVRYVISTMNQLHSVTLLWQWINSILLRCYDNHLIASYNRF